MKNFLLFLFFCFFSISCSLTAEDVKITVPDNFLDGFNKKHPYLIMDNKRLEELKSLFRKDSLLKDYVDQVIRTADKLLDDPHPRYHIPDGKRLLVQSRYTLKLVYYFGLAYRWTNDKKYAERLIKDLRAACKFVNWNPSHYLDTAELCHAVGIGYDWLYSYMGKKDREYIRKNLIEKGLKTFYQKTGLPTKPKKKTVFNKVNNWNVVCNGGVIIGALAIADSDPNYAKDIIPYCVPGMPVCMKYYSPDGAWYEGPGYWSYASRYIAFCLAGLDSALGTDFGLSKLQGISKAAYFPVYTTSPAGYFLAFADCGSKSRRKNAYCIFWYAQKFNNTFFSDDEHKYVKKHGASPGHVMWYVPPSNNSGTLKLDYFFDGLVPVVIFKSTDDAFWVGVKAGQNPVAHGHLDLGNFEIEIEKIRWVVDLGSDNYNMPGYFGKNRYQYYRNNSFSHNVPVINNKNQGMGRAEVLDVKTGESVSSIKIDLSPVYKNDAEHVIRTVLLDRENEFVSIIDNIALKEAGEIKWGFATRAEIKINKNTATLSYKKKRCRVTVVSPSGVILEKEFCYQKPPENSNKEFQRLVFKLKNIKRADIEVRFSQ